MTLPDLPGLEDYREQVRWQKQNKLHWTGEQVDVVDYDWFWLVL
jgi:hypothetical protein